MKLALDLNSFFASCEQQDRPELRGLPIAVVPLLAETTSCIAASHEAKRHGIRTGTRVAEARRLCPGILMIEARPPRYLDYHHRIMACVDTVVPIEARTSIDEAICDLPAGHKTPEKALALARILKQQLAQNVGECLTCSIGIAPNAWLAKTASDMQKPDGLVLLQAQDLPWALYSLSLRDLCGIGPNMEARLRACGIRTVQQLCEATRPQLRRAWGSVEGELMFDRLRGAPVPLTETDRQSVSHSHVLPPVKRNDVDAHSILHRMLQKAAMRLRRMDLVTGQLHISVQFLERHGKSRWGAETHFIHTDDTLALTHHLDQLWRQYPGATRERVPMLVGVVFMDLLESRHQTLPIFAADQPHTRLMQAVDALNVKFGKNTLYFGAAHKGRDHAPMRIAFTRIPDPVTE